MWSARTPQTAQRTEPDCIVLDGFGGIPTGGASIATSAGMRTNIVSMMSFVCSIGNVPLAGVLWNAGISFGGVISFLFADLIILPILAIYKKYYGTKMMLFILGSFYATMVAAGYMVEILFSLLGLVPTERTAEVGGDAHSMELHHGAQHPGPPAGSRTYLSVRPNRRHPNASDDGRRTGRRPRWRGPLGLTEVVSETLAGILDR